MSIASSCLLTELFIFSFSVLDATLGVVIFPPDLPIKSTHQERNMCDVVPTLSRNANCITALLMLLPYIADL